MVLCFSPALNKLEWLAFVFLYVCLEYEVQKHTKQINPCTRSPSPSFSSLIFKLSDPSEKFLFSVKVHIFSPRLKSTVRLRSLLLPHSSSRLLFFGHISNPTMSPPIAAFSTSNCVVSNCRLSHHLSRLISCRVALASTCYLCICLQQPNPTKEELPPVHLRHCCLS